jgi:uncharacterized protein
MRVLRAENYRRMPWKNGGGETTEIAVFPEDAGLNDFDWRVSMARVESSGPFSLFGGVDRTLAILDGEGLLLEIAGRAAVDVTGASKPLSFPADAPTNASLLAGPITDLNVMTRRGRLAHKVARHEFAGSIEIAFDAADTLLLCHSGAIRVSAGGEQASLSQFDTLVFGKELSAARIDAVGRAGLFTIGIDRLS